MKDSITDVPGILVGHAQDERAGTGCTVILCGGDIVASVDVPKAPQEVLIRPDQRVAYVSCDASHKVAVIGIGDWKAQPPIEAGKGVDGLAWAAERQAGPRSSK